MARRGGRRGRRSRSKQRSKGAGSRSSKAKSNKSRSKNTRGSGAKKSSARKSKPSKRRNTRTTSRASNRRSTASKKRQATRKSAPKKKTVSKKKAPAKRRTPTKKSRRGRGGDTSKVKKTVKNVTSKVKKSVKKVTSKVKKAVGKATRPPSARAKTVTSTKKQAPTKTAKTVTKKQAPKKVAPPKSRDQRMRDAARKRHENFKKTRVQTFGGTRKKYSTREAERIRDAGLNFSKVTGGAKNPLARPPINPNIKPGEVMPQVQSFVDSLGLTDLSKNAAPMVNYNFSQRDTSLPSMGQLSKTDLSGFAKSVGANRNIGGGYSKKAFSARPDTNLNMRDLFQAKDLGNMTTNAINTIVDKIPIIGEKLPNLMPMSMTDRDRQQYLGYNPNKPSSYLKQQGRYNDGSGRSDMGGPNNQFIKPEPVENTIVEENNPLANLTEIQQDAYNTALENYNAGTGYSGQGEGTGFGNLSQEVIAALMAGNRGRKRFRYGTAKKRGSDSLLTRGSERFKGFTTTGQLNI